MIEKLKLWGAVALAILAVLVGVRSHYERRLQRERERAREAYNREIDARNHAAASEHAARIARIDQELERHRRTPIEARIAESVREARERRERQRRERS